ncbi:hypothetical protein BsIDN1_61420 [Bacillus safensis]|uniref:Calcineurin-like phosphoesterase domain-containing protein n=1 Tax=Bacillus safensis TaxID=561879 RepID=A0A5S9MK09_BACIA|nr:hypothetical protein BsIDN1_61420 [Bacillus safensis]
MIWMSDTQYYAKSYPHIFKQMVEWIRDQREKLNIQYVFHTGDIVDDSKDKQWHRADTFMRVLDENHIPYGVLAGNHDVRHKDGLYAEYGKNISGKNALRISLTMVNPIETIKVIMISSLPAAMII